MTYGRFINYFNYVVTRFFYYYFKIKTACYLNITCIDSFIKISSLTLNYNTMGISHYQLLKTQSYIQPLL